MWGLLCGTWYYDGSRCVYLGFFPPFLFIFHEECGMRPTREKQLLYIHNIG